MLRLGFSAAHAGRTQARVQGVHAEAGVPCGAYSVALFKTSIRTLIAFAIKEKSPQQSTLIADIEFSMCPMYVCTGHKKKDKDKVP